MSACQQAFELQLIPDTNLMFVWYYEEYYHVSDQREQIQKHNYQRIAHKMMLNQAHKHLDIIIKFLVSLVPSTFSATSFMKDWWRVFCAFVFFFACAPDTLFTAFWAAACAPDTVFRFLGCRLCARHTICSILGCRATIYSLLKYVKGMEVSITMFYPNDALICFSGM